mgnify:CR=1 FL=1
MDIFELAKQVSQMEIADAFKELKSQAEFFQYNLSEAPYYLQPEGNIYTLFEHDFSFSTGDVITYTAKAEDPADANGTWDVFYFVEDNWYRYEDQEFVLHRTSRVDFPEMKLEEVLGINSDDIPDEDIDGF